MVASITQSEKSVFIVLSMACDYILSTQLITDVSGDAINFL